MRCISFEFVAMTENLNWMGNPGLKVDNFEKRAHQRERPPSQSIPVLPLMFGCRHLQRHHHCEEGASRRGKPKRGKIYANEGDASAEGGVQATTAATSNNRWQQRLPSERTQH